MKSLIDNKTTFFTSFFWTVSIFVFIVVAFRCYSVPFSHDEAGTFFMFIQSGNYLPFHSQVDANNHVLNSFLGNICFQVFGSSPFSLRLPNLLGLLLLILSTFRISKYLQHLPSKVFLTSSLLLSFHWLSFYSACRGYGLSMGLLLMGIAFMLEYIKDSASQKKFILSLLFFQFAISANLILIIIVLVLNGIVGLIQFFNKILFKPLNIIIWLIHFGAIYYWLSFSFYLQENGALYYGAGDSYWKVTFVSLVQLLVGYSSAGLKYFLVSLFSLTMIFVIYLNKSSFLKITTQFKKTSFSLLFAFILSVLCIGFYLMHKIMGVNYPEDRTGLFYYLFFVLFFSFTLDLLPLGYNKIILYTGSILFVAHFAFNLNFRKHSLNVYETIPEYFYSTLLNEQAKSTERITIGGHRVRELFYGFMNYRHNGELNSADPTELMQMNCDYYIATKQEEKYYKPYYDVIDTEPDWGFVLLKRKEKINRTAVYELKDLIIKNDNNEFIGLYGHNDTTISNTKPLIAEMNFDVQEIPVPINAWFVFQINDSTEQAVYFKRYPLQWSGYDLNGRKGIKCSVITGNLPRKSSKIACFLWNIEKQPISLKVNSFKIYQIDGNGVEYQAPDIK